VVDTCAYTFCLDHFDSVKLTVLFSTFSNLIMEQQGYPDPANLYAFQQAGGSTLKLPLLLDNYYTIPDICTKSDLPFFLFCLQLRLHRLVSECIMQCCNF
jgi:hypothetical protein